MIVYWVNDLAGKSKGTEQRRFAVRTFFEEKKQPHQSA